MASGGLAVPLTSSDRDDSAIQGRAKRVTAEDHDSTNGEESGRRGCGGHAAPIPSWPSLEASRSKTLVAQLLSASVMGRRVPSWRHTYGPRAGAPSVLRTMSVSRHVRHRQGGRGGLACRAASARADSQRLWTSLCQPHAGQRFGVPSGMCSLQYRCGSMPGSICGAGPFAESGTPVRATGWSVWPAPSPSFSIFSIRGTEHVSVPTSARFGAGVSTVSCSASPAEHVSVLGRYASDGFASGLKCSVTTASPSRVSAVWTARRDRPISCPRSDIDTRHHRKPSTTMRSGPSEPHR